MPRHAATTSSSMMPYPWRIHCSEAFTGHGLAMSKRRKSTKPVTNMDSDILVNGKKISHMPSHSSTTICDGSLHLRILSTRVLARAPRKKRTSSTRQRPIMGSGKKHTGAIRSASNEPHVPGAWGTVPAQPIRQKKRLRLSSTPPVSVQVLVLLFLSNALPVLREILLPMGATVRTLAQYDVSIDFTLLLLKSILTHG